jgi:BASS family bile acid:Na+ symporter
LIGRFLDGLALLARYGTQAFIVSIMAGIALPQLAALARPLLSVCIFMFIALMFARADLAIVGQILRHPRRLVFVGLWLILAPAGLIALGLALVGRSSLDPGLVLGISLIAAAPPILSGPAIAALIGIEPSFILASTLLATLFAPFVSPILADWVAGAAVPLDPAALALRLALLIGSAIAAAALVRRIVGVERLVVRRRSIDGAAVVIYFVFAVAAMDGLTTSAMADPLRVAGFLAVAFLISFAGLAAGWIGLPLLVPKERLMLGYATGQRNMGLLVAALGASVPDTTFLFFSLAQFPIYLMPQLLRTLASYVPEGRAGDPVAGP